jgi:hypothetical protein
VKDSIRPCGTEISVSPSGSNQLREFEEKVGVEPHKVLDARVFSPTIFGATKGLETYPQVSKVLGDRSSLRISDLESAGTSMVGRKGGVDSGDLDKVLGAGDTNLQSTPEVHSTPEAHRSPEAHSTPEAHSALLKNWQTEVAALKGETFSSVHHAAKTVARRVIERLPASSAHAAEEERFITKLLLSDERIVAKLKESLKISS